MKSDLSLKPAFRRRRWIPYLVLVVTLLLTIGATHYVATTTDARDRLRFENAVQRTQDNIQNRLETYMALLRAGSGFFAGSDQVSRDEFRTFVERLELQRRYPGAQGIGFSVRVMPEEKDALVADMQRQGAENFTIRPDFKRSEYHAVAYLEPLDKRNKVAIGFDMFTEPVRRAAMERARDTSAPAASGRVTLVQEIDEHKQAGFLIYVPVYRNGVIPKTVAQRQAALRGFVYSPFRADDLMKGIFGTEKYPAVDFEIYDGTSLTPEHLLHRSNGNRISSKASGQPRFHATTTIDVAGHPWTITFAARPQFFELTSVRNLVPYILLGGLIISSVLFTVTQAQVLAREAAERSAASLHQSQQALRESESRLRQLVDANIIGIIIVNLRGNIIEANDAFLNMVRYTREDLQAGKLDFFELTPSEYRHLDLQAIKELKRTGKHTPFEKEYIRKDGTLVPILLGTAYLGGTDELAVSFLLDLSQQKQVEKSLRNSETRFRTLVEQSPLSTQILSPHGRTIQVNRAWEELWGITLDRLGDYNILEDEQLVAKGIMPYIKQGFAGEVAAIPPVVYDRNQTIPNVSAYEDSPRWVQAYIYPVTDEAGNIREVVLLHEDISDRKRAEKEREQLLAREQAARVEAEAANRMKDEFLATLSHELRTPLNAMLGWTKMLRTRKFDQSTTERALETIERNTKSLAQLIEDILDVSRIITGKLRLNVHPVRLVPVIEAAIDTVRLAANAKEIQIESLLDSSVEPILGDANRLQQVVWNLLSNAVKFTPKGGRVEVRLSKIQNTLGEGQSNTKLPIPNCAQIQVSDTGQGINPDFLPYVFERFRQADSSTTRSYGGLGLGLAIVRHLVELHGGTVYAQSQGIGQGTTFIVNLPLTAVVEQASQPEQVQPTITHEEPANRPPLLDGLRILVVDDQQDVCDLMITMLGQYGAQVIAVATSSEALEALTHNDFRSQEADQFPEFVECQEQVLNPKSKIPDPKFDILVSDIGMPEEDGYTLIRKVRALSAEQGGRIPAVALTAYARAEDRKQAMLAGFQVHIPKPVDPDELAVAIANLTGRTVRA